MFRSPLKLAGHLWMSTAPDTIHGTVTWVWHWHTWGKPAVKWSGVALAALSLSLSLLMAGPALGAPMQEEDEVIKFEWIYGFDVKFLGEYDRQAGELKLSLDDIEGQIAVVETGDPGFRLNIGERQYGILRGTTAAEAVIYLARSMISIKEVRERTPIDPRKELDQWVKDHEAEP